MCACNGAIPPKPSPLPLPEWITLVVTPIKATSEQAKILQGNNSGGPSSSAPQPVAAAAAAAAPAGSPGAETLRHPDPSTSLEELRWRDYQTLHAGGVPTAVAAPAALQQQPQPAAAAAATGLGAAPVFGAAPGLGAAPVFGAAPGLGAAPIFGATPGFGTTPVFVAAPVFGAQQNAAGTGAAPNTPPFITPVRTLFPPTPLAPVGAAAPGGLHDDAMDTSASVDLESQIHSMYARPENAVASPEEMRIVQVESYKAGRQIAPYWLIGGAS